MKLDSIDRTILNFLQKDAKLTHKQLALKLNLSTTAIFERIKKLEKAQYLVGYAAIVDRRKLDLELLVFSHIKLVRHSHENISDFEKQIAHLEEVLECYHVSGDYDYILKMAFPNMDIYRDFLVNKLTTISNIGNTQSIFVINEVKHKVGFHL